MRRTLELGLLLIIVGAFAGLSACGESGTADATSGEGEGEGEIDWDQLGEWERDNGYEEEWESMEAPQSQGYGGDRGDWDAEYAPTADDAEAHAGSEGEGEPYDPSNGGGGLEGGETDDNERWEEYLAYVEAELDDASIGSNPMTHWLDVRERFWVRVIDSEGVNLPGVEVLIKDGERVVTWGVTYADGRFPFYPSTHAGAGQSWTAEVKVDGLTATTAFGLGDALEQTLSVPLERAAGQLKLDVAFVIDATGSMGGEIDRIKATVRSIAQQLTDSEFQPDLRFGFVEYRDRGDEFLTHTVNFTHDIELFDAAVAELQAGGGGDGPEALNAALFKALHRLEWRGEDTLRLAFVVADAPPHYYEDEQYTYDIAMQQAVAKGVKLFPIASGGSDGVAEFCFRQLAQYTLARFLFITEGGGSHHGSEGSEYEVDPESFDVENLDGLVVRLVGEEMADWSDYRVR